MFRSWLGHVPADLELCAVELPGRGVRSREPLATSIDAIARELLTAVESLGDAPVTLFGHSFGGLVAFELAHLLVGIERPPQALCVAACPHPSAIARSPTWSELSDERLVELLGVAGGVPATLLEQQDARELFLPPLRADLRLFWSQPERKRPPLPLALDVLIGQKDPYWPEATFDGWHGESSQVRLRSFPGGHFFIHQHAARIVDLLAGHDAITSSTERRTLTAAG